MKILSEILRLIVAIAICSFAIIATSCKGDDEPTGTAGALGKSFNLAIDNVTSSLAYSLLVSPDGSKILATMASNNTEHYYSSDGGTTFTQVGANLFLPKFLDIDNQGNILTDDDRVFNNGTFVNSISTFDQLILGSDGKLFSYNSNSGAIKYTNAGTFGTLTDVAPPDNSGNAVIVSKARGKGLLYLSIANGGADLTAYFLNESTLQWSDPVSFSVDFNAINNCNNLNRYTRYSYAGNDIITVKGCTGAVLFDITNSASTTIAFPTDEQLIYEDVRDGQLFVDSKKQVYLVSRTYTDLTKTSVYKFDGSQWSTLDGFMPLGSNGALFASDLSGNVYFNADGAGESLKGTVKVNVNTDTKTGLALPTTGLTITDAAGTGDDHLMIVVDGQLYDYDLSAHTATNLGLKEVSHVNVLSDGRYVAGGADHVYFSTDGKNWTETKTIFSSADPTRGQASVVCSRIINGKTVLVGVFQYYYDNLSLGIRQTKYNDIVIELNGSASSKLNYQLPNDFLPASIGPDGVLYGVALFVNEFGTITDRYELKQDASPERLTTKGMSPQVVTDDGLQLAITPAQGGGHFEIVSRHGDSEEWSSTNTVLPGDFTGNGLLRQSGDKLVYVHSSEVYLSGN